MAKASFGPSAADPARRTTVALNDVNRQPKADLRVIRRDEISAGYIKTVGLFDPAEVEPTYPRSAFVYTPWLAPTTAVAAAEPKPRERPPHEPAQAQEDAESRRRRLRAERRRRR